MNDTNVSKVNEFATFESTQKTCESYTHPARDLFSCKIGVC